MNQAPIAEMDRRFGIPGVARVCEGRGGLAKVAIDARGVTGEMYLHGAHVTAWRPAGGEEALFVSARSRWEDGRAIRGGVPICFPWFGDKRGDLQAPAHGFVRTKAWRLESIVDTGDAIAVSMVTESSDETKRWWPADFRLVHRATFGATLGLELTLANTGSAPLRFEEASHAYFRVDDIRKAVVLGLDATDYIDKTDANQKKTQQGPITITAETDRVYLNARSAVTVEDQASGRRIEISKQNSSTTVVWNPWIAKAKAMADFGDDEWSSMICVETSNVGDFAVELAPGEEHCMQAMVRIADR